MVYSRIDLRQISIGQLRLAMTMGTIEPGIWEPMAAQALAAANSNASHNTYLWRDAEAMMEAARRASESGFSRAKGRFGHFTSHAVFWGLPISVKDCFDLAGAPTSCGTRFYRDWNGVAAEDSWLVEMLRKNGAVITGKTHLHPLAYGITGENPEFGDCVQPGNPGALTGGSSSGAAASILEGSAIAAIGTDTGGSIRVPAALCGLAGYRATLGHGDWRGAAHLAPSFDTMGWLFRDLQDGPTLGGVFPAAQTTPPTPMNPDAFRRLLTPPRRFAVVDERFLEDCEPAVRESLASVVAELQSLGMTPTTISVDWWSEARDIFAPIQASEAAQIHAGNFAAIAPEIRQRLEWGASLSSDEVAKLRERHAEFRGRMDALLAEHEFLLMPAAPVAMLAAGADHSQTRIRLLRYTTPVSLAGMPAVTIPVLVDGKPAGGMQLIAAREEDQRLLKLTAKVGEKRKSQLKSLG